MPPDPAPIRGRWTIAKDYLIDRRWGVPVLLLICLAPCVAFPFAYNLMLGLVHGG